jgi:hypothetical protein
MTLAAASMTRHIAAYFSVPLFVYFLYFKRSNIFKEKGFWLFVVSALLLMSPWLIAMTFLFGNPFYPQMYNLAIVGNVDSYYYFEMLPAFLGFQGLLMIPSLFDMKKEKFTVLAALVTFLGLLILSLVWYKEDRYLLILVPGIVCLEGFGMNWFMKKVKIKDNIGNMVLVFIAVLVFAISVTFPPNLPNDSELISCVEMAKPYINSSIITTSSPYLALEYKRPFQQLPWTSREFSCDSLRESKADYVVYFEDWWYGGILKTDFLSQTSSCLRLLNSEGKCSLYQVKYV